MRVNDGARKINRHGGAIFIHEDWHKVSATDLRVVTDIPQSPVAPIEIRDFVYGKLIELSPATLYPGTLIAGEKGLLARGLVEHHFGNYGGLPADSRDRDRIARLLLQKVNDRYRSEITAGSCGSRSIKAHYSKEKVCFHLALLVAGVYREKECSRRLASWDVRVKGIDDAAFRNLTI